MKKSITVATGQNDNDHHAELWVLFIEGDASAFNILYSFYYQMLYNFGKRFLDSTEVEDCIHDTFLNILKYKNSAKNVSNVKAYLFKCLRNQIYKFKKTTLLEFDLIEGTIPYEEDDQDKELLLKQLKKIIKKLSPREREIIYLKYFQGFNNIEISELLDINYQTVRNILVNAIKKLRVLGEEFIELLFLLFSK
ncbi:hypothetical protein APS56_00945 [Pseudalgibacter alginicilyticus]|uniref:HTH luxR-type domain-containing protein n=1 Tax=Pseudalgibacter alginicilyticus TaxID=1736674 RepID=A0A0P0CM36_9FLAO|nr:sigma-70 family RNA polymerase sigma factor [Pseudalgibacter alginicilyticus]ALJ03803.1 hypothetical protein APS56_00945 [Pseudalgibacter alginicilyticus]